MQVHPEEGPCGSEQLQPLGPVLRNLPGCLGGVVVARLEIRQMSISTLRIPSRRLGAARPFRADGEEVRHLLSRREGVEFVPEVGKVGLGADVPLVAAEEGGEEAPAAEEAAAEPAAEKKPEPPKGGKPNAAKRPGGTGKATKK